MSKLRENNKTVIGVGVKNSTSDLLTANCDEFIFYDDLVRSTEKKSRSRKRKPAAKADPRQEAFELVRDTLAALVEERGEDDKIWGSMIKQTLKRRKPGFAESYYGFDSFNKLLEAMSSEQLLKLTRDERSGGYLVRSKDD